MASLRHSPTAQIGKNCHTVEAAGPDWRETDAVDGGVRSWIDALPFMHHGSGELGPKLRGTEDKLNVWAQQVKISATKSDYLSLSSGTYIKERTNSHKLSSVLHMHAVTAFQPFPLSNH